MLDIKNLKVFVEIVKQQSFSLAAEHLYMTQPTVSKTIVSLENDLGISLFKKGESGRKRDVQLTQAGEYVYAHALKILNEQKQLYDTIDEIKHLKKGTLTLGLPPLGSLLLAPLIAEFIQHYPDIELTFLEVGSNIIEQAILAKTLDVGVLLSTDNPLFGTIPILDSPLCLLSEKKSRWRHATEVKVADLRDESFLLYDDSFTLNGLIIDAAKLAGFTPKIVCKSSQWDFIAKMVEYSMGIALLPQIYCQQLDTSKFNITPLKDATLRWTLSMAWSKTASMSTATCAWLDLVQKHRIVLDTTQL